MKAAKASGIDISKFDIKTVDGRKLLGDTIKNATNHTADLLSGSSFIFSAQAVGTIPSVQEGNISKSVRQPAGTVSGRPDNGKPQPVARGASDGVRRVTGSADIPLTDVGKKQSIKLSEKITEPFDVIFHAPNGRSTETANIFGAKSSSAPIPVKPFDGWARGKYEGRPADAVKPAMSHLIIKPDEVPQGKSPISGKIGQSWNEMAKPMFAVILEIVKSLPHGDRALVITSGGNLQAIDAWGKAGYPDDFEFPHDRIAMQPYWSVTGKLFILGEGGLEEVEGDEKPGVYFMEHGETAFNSKGDTSGDHRSTIRDAYRKISEFDHAIKAYDSASDNDKKLLHRDARDRAFAAKYKPHPWAPETKKIVLKHFNVKPGRLSR